MLGNLQYLAPAKPPAMAAESDGIADPFLPYRVHVFVDHEVLSNPGVSEALLEPFGTRTSLAMPPFLC